MVMHLVILQKPPLEIRERKKEKEKESYSHVIAHPRWYVKTTHS
jgi:hypothetical protein